MFLLTPTLNLATALATTLAASHLPDPCEPREVPSLQKEVVIHAPLQDVWRAWTTEEGLAAVSPQSRIDLRPGGDYAWFLQLPPDARGRRGSEGSRIVAIEPHRALAFDWTFPPDTPGLRAAGATTRVAVCLEETGPGVVRVRLTATGWEEGGEWDLGYAYLDQAWEAVLQGMKRALETHADDPQAEITRLLTDHYVAELFIDRDEAAIRPGFHPDFRLFVLTDQGVLSVSLDEWLERLGLDGTPSPRRYEHQVTVLDVQQNAALARVDLWEDGRHLYVDFFSLYRLPEGWKVVAKTFQSPD